MEIKVLTKYLKISPKKLQPIAGLIKNKEPETALDELRFCPKKGAKFILKSLESALANARHNYDLKPDDLLIKEVLVNTGPVLKRFTAKAMGSAAPIRKRTSHLRIVLEAKPSYKPEKKEVVLTEKVKKPMPPSEEKIEKKKVLQPKKPDISKRVFDEKRAAKHRHKQHLDKLRMKEKGGILKRIFRRKSGE